MLLDNEDLYDICLRTLTVENLSRTPCSFTCGSGMLGRGGGGVCGKLKEGRVLLIGTPRSRVGQINVHG